MYVKLTDAEKQQQFLRDGQYCPAIKPLPEMDRILANNVVYEQKKCDKPVEPQRAVEAVVHASMPVKAFLLARSRAINPSADSPFAVRKIHHAMRYKKAVTGASRRADSVDVEMILFLLLF